MKKSKNYETYFEFFCWSILEINFSRDSGICSKNALVIEMSLFQIFLMLHWGLENYGQIYIYFLIFLALHNLAKCISYLRLTFQKNKSKWLQKLQRLQKNFNETLMCYNLVHFFEFCVSAQRLTHALLRSCAHPPLSLLGPIADPWEWLLKRYNEFLWIICMFFNFKLFKVSEDKIITRESLIFATFWFCQLLKNHQDIGGCWGRYNVMTWILFWGISG